MGYVRDVIMGQERLKANAKGNGAPFAEKVMPSVYSIVWRHGSTKPFISTATS